MTDFTAFDVQAYQVDAFQNGGGALARRGGWLPWWARKQHFEMLLEEERRLAREAARLEALAQPPADDLTDRLAANAAILLSQLQAAPAAPKPKTARPARAPAPPKPLETALLGPFQHLLHAPPVRAAAPAEISQDEINEAIEIIEAIEDYERSLEAA